MSDEEEDNGVEINNRKTYPDEHVFYVDHDKVIHEAVIKSITKVGDNHHADLEYKLEGKTKNATNVPHNTSVEAHSWNHPMTSEERETHYSPTFYG